MLDFQGVYLWNRFGNRNSLCLRCLHLEPRMTHWAICNDLTSTYSSNSGNQSRNLQRTNSSKKFFVGGELWFLLFPSLASKVWKFPPLHLGKASGWPSGPRVACLRSIPAWYFLGKHLEGNHNINICLSQTVVPQWFFNDFLKNDVLVLQFKS